MGRLIGIDLGTTNSVVAVMEGGTPVVIANDEGDRKTPSVVAYTHDGERLVGTIAKRQAILNPQQTIYSIKRFVGRRFEEIQDECKFVPYSVVPAENGEARVEIDGRDLHAVEITAQVLMKLKLAAENYLGEAVTAAVITVPAYFNDAQRQATKDAGTIAGLEVKRLVNEPTAAAMAYGFDKKGGQTVAVYDFGGGTFDISILAISDNVIRVLGTNGDTHLGGDNIDDRIVEWLLREFMQETGIDASTDRVALQRLKDAAEKAKIELSGILRCEISLPFLAADASGPRHLVRELTRAGLEAMIEDLLNATITPTLSCLGDANLRPTDVDEVILVGGTTRMPRVQQVVQSLFMKEPNNTVDPDEVVAIGAAIQAAILTGEMKDMLLLDVTSLSLGIQTGGGLMTKVIHRNTSIPVRETKVFTTSSDNLTLVDVHVLQGERETAAANRTLGNFRLAGIPPAPRGVPRIEVTFDIDSNGIVGVTAKDLATGAKHGIEISGAAGLTREEVEAMVADAVAHRDGDLRERSLIETTINAERLVAQAERFLHDNGADLSDGGSTLGAATDSLIQALAAELDAGQLGRQLDFLQRALYAARSALYAGDALSAPAAGAGVPGNESAVMPSHEVPMGDASTPAESGFGAPSYGVDGRPTSDNEPAQAPPRKRTFGGLLAQAASRFTRGQGKKRNGEADAIDGNTLRSSADDAAPTQLVTPRVSPPSLPPPADAKKAKLAGHDEP